MSHLRFALALLAGTSGVLLRRLFGRRLRPAWSLRMELLHCVSRCMLDRTFIYGLPWLRSLQDRSPLSPALARQVSFAPERAGDVPGEWCTPKVVDGERTILFVHGGGYVIGSLASHRDLVARIAVATRSRVLALDYRLGPEHLFPAAHDDCLAATRWLLDTGVDPATLGMAGDSAGAALCLATLLALREEGRALPAAAALLCPWVDPLADGGSVRQNAAFDIADRGFLVGCFEQYRGDADAADPQLTPLRADLTGLPPLLIQAGQAEMILDQARAMAAKALAAGVDVQLEEFPDMFHDFQAFSSLIPEGRKAIDQIGEFLRQRLVP